MGITIKYRALAEAPILETLEGSYASQRLPASPDLNTPFGMWQNSRHYGLAGDMLEAEQNRVLINISQRINNLASAIDNVVVPSSDDLSAVKTALSSQPSRLTAIAEPEADAPATHSVQVDWPTAPGEISSKPQNPIELTTMTDGNYTFKLVVDGDEHTITVPVNRSDTVDSQEDILGRLARAIDAADSRISAEVEQGFTDAYDPAPRSQPMDRFVRLKITSAESGQGPDFYLEDVTEDGLVAAYGLDSGTPARAARLNLEGATADQGSDLISLDGGNVSATALDSTDGAARVQVSQGPQTIQDQLKNVITQYDDLMTYLDAHADVLRPSLKDRIMRPLEDRAQLMQDLGLRATPQGRLVMNDNFDQRVAANFAGIRKDLLGSGGWMPALRKKLGQLQSMKLSDFAATVKTNPVVSERARARALVDSLAVSIISDYF